MGKSFLPTPQVFNAPQTQVLISDILTAIDASNKMSAVKSADFYCDMTTYFYPTSAGFGATVNAYLPTAVSSFSKPYCFRSTGLGTTTINRATGSSDTVDGAATKIVGAGVAMIIRSDGVSKWYVESVS